MQHIAALGRQRRFRFVVAGTANTLVSQGALLVLLGALPVISATLLSQLLHAGCSYLTSARAVFGCSGSPQLYVLVVTLSWLMQWQALAVLLRAELQRSHAVAMLVPVLALTSYSLQRRLVFR
ncbi:GtrA family protein [Synechococcus sp. MIT S9508]|uniref:GtrA family protein n=1 Tax=Synechococcus sp. MIT S9508 TaxID=1801629 RepID=UPI001E3D8021|nr:GtrA family protein [Synechococcus sp. MIT S9508]